MQDPKLSQQETNMNKRFGEQINHGYLIIKLHLWLKSNCIVMEIFQLFFLHATLHATPFMSESLSHSLK